MRAIYKSRLLTDTEGIDMSGAKEDLIKSIDLDPSWSIPQIEIRKINEELENIM